MFDIHINAQDLRDILNFCYLYVWICIIDLYIRFIDLCVNFSV